MSNLLIEKIENGFLVTNRGGDKYTFVTLAGLIDYVKTYYEADKQ